MVADTRDDATLLAHFTGHALSALLPNKSVSETDEHFTEGVMKIAIAMRTAFRKQHPSG